jgi:hypothetical protein
VGVLQPVSGLPQQAIQGCRAGESKVANKSTDLHDPGTPQMFHLNSENDWGDTA